MQHPDYNSPQALKTFLEERGLSMQKKFGQNFLVNGDARKKLVDALDVSPDTYVWEVGPGLGCMTSDILERGAKLTVFEIDRGFAQLVRDFFSEDFKDTFNLVEGDVLKTWQKELKRVTEEGGKLPDRFFGNLPYNVAASIVADTIENNIRFDKCVFTVQKEVAVRMAAKPGSEDYSSLSVLCNWAYDIKNVVDLAGGNFWPKPNVDSRAVLFTKKADFPRCQNPSLFIKMQRALFSSRRKTVRNNLYLYLKNNDMALAALEKAGIDPMKRAEVLTLDEMLKLSDVLNEMK